MTRHISEDNVVDLQRVEGPIATFTFSIPETMQSGRPSLDLPWSALREFVGVYIQDYDLEREVRHEIVEGRWIATHLRCLVTEEMAAAWEDPATRADFEKITGGVMRVFVERGVWTRGQRTEAELAEGALVTALRETIDRHELHDRLDQIPSLIDHILQWEPA